MAGFKHSGGKIITPKDRDAAIAQRQTIQGGATAGRPAAELLVLGECYFDTDLGKPIWWQGTKWVYSDGTDA